MRKLQTNRASTSDMSGATVNVGDYINIVDAAGAAKAGVKKERGGESVKIKPKSRQACSHA